MSEDVQTIILFGSMWAGLLWFFYVLARFLSSHERAQPEAAGDADADAVAPASPIDFGL